MTEIQWLCDILLNHRLPSTLKDRFVARIGEVEASLTKGTPLIPLRPEINFKTAQAPSTQRLLDQQAGAAEVPVAKVTPVPSVIDKETGRAMVATGKGTAGPRKF